MSTSPSSKKTSAQVTRRHSHLSGYFFEQLNKGLEPCENPITQRNKLIQLYYKPNHLVLVRFDVFALNQTIYIKQKPNQTVYELSRQ